MKLLPIDTSPMPLARHSDWMPMVQDEEEGPALRAAAWCFLAAFALLEVGLVLSWLAW